MITRALTQQGGRYVQSSAPAGVINLALGQPSPRLLPIAELGRAAASQLAADRDPLVLQYGTRLGYEDFRVALAEFLTAEYGHPVAADELMVTGGTSMALTFVSETFAEPGDAVVCEDPTYFLACGVFDSAHLRTVGIPIDERGLCVDALAERLADGLAPALVYCIPAFQNPGGVSLEPARAEQLIDLAEAHDFLVVADEPYLCLHWGDAGSPGSLVRYDRGRGRVLSLGSFSKLLAPGLRLGWAHGAPALVDRLGNHGAVRSGGCFNPVVANIVHHTLDSGFLREHVDGLRTTFGERCRALSDALTTALPDAQFRAPSGGYFLWLELPGVDTAQLLSRARGQVRFLPGPRCAVERELSSCARLSFAFYESDELREGAHRLGRALREL